MPLARVIQRLSVAQVSDGSQENDCVVSGKDVEEQRSLDELLLATQGVKASGEAEQVAELDSAQVLQYVLAYDTDHIIERIIAHIDAYEQGLPQVRNGALEGKKLTQSNIAIVPRPGVLIVQVIQSCLDTPTQPVDAKTRARMQEILNNVLDELLSWYKRGTSHPQTDLFAVDLTGYLVEKVNDFPLHITGKIALFLVHQVLQKPSTDDIKSDASVRSNSNEMLHARAFDLLPACLNALAKAELSCQFPNGSTASTVALAADGEGIDKTMLPVASCTTVSARYLLKMLVNPSPQVLWRREYVLPMCIALQDALGGNTGQVVAAGSLDGGEEELTTVGRALGQTDSRVRSKVSQDYVLELIVDKVLQHMPAAAQGDVPLIVYQVFLLSKKFSPAYKKRLLFEHVEAFFVMRSNELEEQPNNAATKTALEQLSITESATLMHITMSIKQDHILGAEFVHYMKGLKRARLNSFNLCLLLVMAKVKRYSETVLHLLRKEIESILKQRYELQQMTWLQGFSPFKMVDLDVLLNAIMRKTQHNWEMLEGLFDLGVQMLEAHPLTALPAASNLGTMPSRLVYIAGLSSPASIQYRAQESIIARAEGRSALPPQQCALLGAHLLSLLFQHHEMVRPQIFDCILRGITMSTGSSSSSWATATATSSASGTTSTSVTGMGTGIGSGGRGGGAANYIDLLAHLIYRCPSFVLMKSVDKLKDCLDQIPYLPDHLGLRLLQVLLPLTQWSHNFASTIMLFLRKGLFGRDLALRQVCLMGYIALLSFWKQQRSSAIPDSTQDVGMIDNGQHDGLLPSHVPISTTEVLNILRRVLTQQCELRLRLYDALMSLVYQYPDLSSEVFEMLRRHFGGYVTSACDNYLAPLRIDRCLEVHSHKEAGPQMREPIPWLVSCLSHTLRVSSVSANVVDVGTYPNNGTTTTSIASKLVDTDGRSAASSELYCIATRMAQCELADFDLNMASEFSLSSNQAQKNYLAAMTVVNLYEAMFEHVFNNCSRTVDDLSLVAQLFEKRHAICESIRKRFMDAKGKKVGTAVLHCDTSILSLKSLALLCAYVADLGGDEPATVHKLIKDNDHFVRYLITNIHAKVQKTTREIDSHDEDTYNGCIALARVMLSQYIGSKGSGMEQVLPTLSRKEKIKSMFTLAVETFESILHIICTSYPDRLEAFLDTVNLQAYSPDLLFTQVARRTDENVLEEHINHLLKLLEALLLHDVNLSKEAITVTRIISTLADAHLVRHVSQVQQLPQLRMRFYKICQRDRYSITDPSLVKVLVGLLLRLTRNDEHMGTLILLTRNVRYQLGEHQSDNKNDENTELERGSVLDIISLKTVVTVQSLLCGQIEESLSQIDWCLTEYRQEYTDSAVTSSQTQTFESRLGFRLRALIESMIHMSQARPPLDNVEQLLRALNHTFSTLTAFVKFKLKQKPLVKPDTNFHDIARAGAELHDKFASFVINVDQLLEPLKGDRSHQTGSDKASKKKEGQGTNKTQQAREERQLKKVKIQGRLMSSVTLSAEKFDVALINLSNIFKSLSKYIKRSAVRDFRIDAHKLQEESSESETEEQSKKHNDHHEDGNPQKKARVS